MRGENGGKGGKGFRNYYKGHMDKTKVGVGSREGVEDGWSGGCGGGIRETAVLEKQ